MTTPIENVLAARDPALVDENDWEEFALADVKVHLPGKARYANILFASADSPVCVSGRLEEVEEEQESLVLDESYRKTRVIIDNVTHYAYGQHDDGEVGLWVAGEAGWFSIKPAKGYIPMFNEMVEAIDLLYFLADKHQRRVRGKKKWNPKLERLFDEYSRHNLGCEDADDAKEIFQKHHAFLIKKMVEGREGVEWASTHIYEHLQESYPDLFEEAEQETNGAPEKSSLDGTSEDMNELNEDAEDGGAAEDERAQADTIFETILDMKEAGLLSKRQLTLQKLAETLLERHEMDDLEYALDLVKTRAGYVTEMMDNAQTSTFDWSRRTIYKELKAAQGWESTQHIDARPLHPRQLDSGTSSTSPDEEGESEEEVPLPKGKRRRGRKSVLRPKLSSVSAKGAGKGTREPEIDNSESDEDIEEPALIDETPSRIPGHGHQLVHEALSTKINESTRSILSESDVLSARKTPLQDSFTSLKAPSSHNSEVAVLAETNDPDLPPDTWVCSVQGCGKVVYKASSKRSKEAILDHSLVHAEDTQSKLDLVFAEQRLNVNASVSHLLSRIRDFGALQDSLEENGENSSPKRIKT